MKSKRDKAKQVCQSRSISLYSHRNVEISKRKKRKERERKKRKFAVKVVRNVENRRNKTWTTNNPQLRYSTS